MSRTAIITDTDASLPLELAQRANIVQVPIMVQFDKESFRAVYDLNDAETFRLIDKTGKLPTTSAPSPGQFKEAFENAFKNGYDDIVCFTVSAEVSATYSAALTAADLFPEKDIRVIDTRSLSIAQGFQVLAAAEVINKGLAKENALALAEYTGQHTHLFVSLSTLKYLAMSGRVGHLAAGIAGLLDVKPILTIQNGKLDMLERVRTQATAWGRTIELAVGAAAGSRVERMAVVHVNALEAAKSFEQRLRSYLHCPDEILYVELTPGLSVHSGAGLVGVCFVTE